MPRDTWFTEFYFDVLGAQRSWRPCGHNGLDSRDIRLCSINGIRHSHAVVRAHLAEHVVMP